MRLEEIQSGTAENQRVKRMKDNAKQAQQKVKQLKAQTAVYAAHRKVQQAKDVLSKSAQSTTGKTIKPH